MSDVRLTTGQALVRWLSAQYSSRDGVRRRAVPAVWGIFGHGNVLGLGQALAQEGEDLPLYAPKHEQSMVHSALGFAKAARRLQLHACTASIGPGATNLLTGAATATVNRLPVLLLPADTFASRRSGVVLQELEDPAGGDLTVNDAFRPLSRHFDRVARPEQLLTALPRALRVLLDPAETGAVTVALHQDVLGEAFAWPSTFFAPRTWVVSRRPPAEEELSEVRSLLRAARRPLVIAGGGVRYSEAEAALASFSRAHGIPVAETSAGKGVMAPDPLNLGGIGVNGTGAARQVAAQADLVVCVGTRLTDFTTGSLSLFADPSVRFIGINVCAADAMKLGATPLVADARLALEALSAGVARAASRADVVAAQAAWSVDVASRPAGFSRRAVYETVNADASAGDWVVAAAGWSPGDLLKLWKVPVGGHAHLEFGFSCMGHELPSALGIRLHEGPDGEVFVIVGDGSLLMAPGELLTAVQEGLKVTLVVVDNAGFGSIDALARDTTGVSLGNRFVGRDGALLAVDYAALAASLGCRGVRAGDERSLAAALREARAGDVTTVIHCPVADGDIPASGAFWDLGVPEVATDGGATRRIARALAARGAAGQRRFA
ncbi:thiamine pyrophosphate-binding protein [Solirubrobacter ginsenosidimutans]|uniref:Thiamine pyrophosphate-binding protein n=1 Tax=Solirubrobacter ginsenosidimutans TaxID=490573 RepID=A0A9X3MP96_9ACTN|nr:thiamine pyrophosphate-dependent enzyme [Solirubrobacter ginsenosidimutans]MDA0159790.1 thiamine pyrophosphate-binding protein [Solirubrobacter ginsenosidimutans]